MYFITETDANGFVNNPQRWYPCRAKSLSGAMRAAQRVDILPGLKAGDSYGAQGWH
jgi:hypothetical protein